MDTPKKIWVDEPDVFVKPIMDTDIPYIRADIVDELVRALNGVVVWDKTRNFLIPYCVRDPIHAALKKLEDV